MASPRSLGNPLFKQEHTPWEDPSARPAWPRRDERQYLVVILLAVGFLAVVATLPLYQERQVPVATDAILPELESHSPQGIADRIEQAVRSYLLGRTVDEKLPFVRRPAAVRHLMQDHMLRHPVQPCEVLDVHVVATYDALDRDHPLFLVAARTTTSTLRPLIVEAQNDRYRVDWESHVGYSPMDIEPFLRTPSGSSMWFRVHASQSSYHNHRFDDPNDTVALRLTFPGTPTVCYAYLSRHHPQFSSFARLLAGKTSVPMILTLGQESLESGRQRQVKILRLIQEKWFVNEDAPSYTAAWAGSPTITSSR